MRRNIKKIIAMFIFLFMSLIMFASASPSGEIEGITENEPGITVDENTEERTEVADEENIEENINLGALGAGAGVNNPVVNPAENPVENPDWKWTISFDTDGGSSVANLTVDHNQRATTPTNPTKVGYSFVGWFLGEELFNFNAIITQNYSLKAVWAPNTDTAYKVNHYLENIEDAEYTLLATDEKTGTTGENTESEARTLAGFTALAITEKPINADGSTVVDIYYARNKYTLTYKITGDIDADDEYHVETAVKFETNLSELAKPKKPGYAFIGWTGFVSTMPAADLEITGYFELDEDNQEDWINLSFVAGENGSLEGTLKFRVLKAYPINSDEQVYKVIIPTPKANDGYAFDKWDNEIDLNATLTEDTTFVALFKDILPPAIENLKVVRDITNDDEIKVFGKIYDANIKNYNLRIVDQDKKLVSPWKGITVPENRDGELGVFDISDLAEGNYFVRVWANDTYGNSTGHNPHIYLPFTIDRTAPTITVKPAPASIGLIEEVIFSKVSFKLYDKYKIDYVVLNGVKKDLTNNQWSDLNDVRPGIYGAVEGENELVLYDVAGNKTSYKFILDTKAPTITVKPAPASIGLIEEVIFSKVSFKLYDKYKIDYVVLNGVKKDLTNNQWSDLNDVRPGIYGAVEGENELVLYDVAGNKTSYKFILDTKAPIVSDITIDPYINNNTGGSKVTVYFKLNDPAGIDLSKTYVMFADGPNTARLKKESEKLNPILISENNYKVEFNSRDFVAANYVGNYNLQFTMVDNLGNRTSTKPAEFRPILVDNSGPEASLTSPISGTTVKGTVRFNFEVSDHTEVASGYMKLREMDKTFNLIQGTANNWYVEIDTNLLTNTTHTIDVRFIDVFGNPRASKNKGTFNVDNKGPVINHVYYKNDWEEKAWSTGTSNTKRTKTMRVRFTVTDNVEVDYVRVFWTNQYNVTQGFAKLKTALLNNPELAGTELVTKAADGYYYSTAPAGIEGTYKMGIVAVDINGNVTAWPGYDMHFMIEEEVVDTSGPNISSIQYKNDWEEKAWYPGTSNSKRTNTMTVKFKVDDPSGVDYVKVIWTNKYNVTQGHSKLREAMRNNPNLDGLEIIEKNEDGRYHSTAPTGIKGIYKMGIIAVDTKGNIRTWVTPDMHFKDERSYRVEHYFQNILNDEYTLDDEKTQILHGMAGVETKEETIVEEVIEEIVEEEVSE